MSRISNPLGEYENLFHELIPYRETTRGVPIIGKPEWKTIVIPNGTDMGKHMFDCIAAIGRKVGNKKVIVIEGAAVTRIARAHEIEWGYDFYLDAIHEYGAFDVAMFDKSVRWVVLLQGCTTGYLAADAECLDIFIDACGGIDVVKEGIRNFLRLDPALPEPNYPWEQE